MRRREGSAVGRSHELRFERPQREEGRIHTEITSVEETTAVEGAFEHRASIAT